TAPPRQGPSIIFCGCNGALLRPSCARKVRWIASGVSSRPRVTSATIAGQLLPDGCFSLGWKRSLGSGGRCKPRDARDLSTSVSSADFADCQLLSGLLLRSGSPRSIADPALPAERFEPFAGQRPRCRNAAMTDS